MPTLIISKHSKMKTIKLNKNGKARQPKSRFKVYKPTGVYRADNKGILRLEKYDAVEALREDIIKFAEKYWDNGGLYNDCDLDELVEKIHDIVR